MSRELVFALIAAAAVLILTGMWWGWRRRSSRDRAIEPPTSIPEAGTTTAVYEGFYVATTQHDDPLNRLAVAHLAFRGRVEVTTRDDGIVLAVRGESPVFIAAGSLVGVGRATWTIDRVVETGGLVLVAWRPRSDLVIDTYLRFEGALADEFVVAVEALLPAQTSTGSDS